MSLVARTLRLEPDAPPALHDGMELMVVHRGALPLGFEARQVQLAEGQTVLSWAAVPRLVVGPVEALATVVEIPLERFLAWRLPETLTARLLAGEPSFGLVGDVEGMAALKWEEDLASPDPYVARAAELEVQAAVLRLARQSATVASSVHEPAVWRQAVAYILTHLAEPLPIERIAAEVGRHPSHVMRLFRRQTGTILATFVLRHRLARAKRLLIESRLPISEVAARAGFRSERRFFEVFRQSERTTPAAYRRHRTP